MKTKIALLTLILMMGLVVPSISAESIPSWIKNNAGWWADGTISENEFVSGIQFLIKEGVIIVPPTVSSGEASDKIPEWVKNNAGWWADGTISDGEFVSAIQYLMKVGIIAVPQTTQMPTASEKKPSSDSELTSLQAELDKCSQIKRAYERLDCEKAAKLEIQIYEYQKISTPHVIGPVTFYYPGLGVEGNEFKVTESGQAILSIRMLAINTGSNDNIAMMCTGPSICAYDVTNGQKTFKYSGMDFTNGQLILKSGEARIFNMLFGPNIGYGGTTFEYDSSKDYSFRVSEPWGSGQIPLPLP